MGSLSDVFKAYDIRGIVPAQLNEDQFRAIGMAAARFADSPTMLVGRDMRASGEALSAAFAEGVRAEGVRVIDLGLASTDLVYFAAGSPRCARCHVHRLSQSRPVQRLQALPVRRTSGRPGHGTGGDRGDGRRAPRPMGDRRPPSTGPFTPRTARAPEPARGIRHPRAVLRRRRRPRAVAHRG